MIGKLFLRVIGGLMLGCVLAVLGVAFAVWHTARATDDTRSDAIVVMGAAQYNGVPSGFLQWRLQHALDLWRQGVAKTIVTVGGSKSGDAYSEASAGKRWLVEEGGVPESAVVAVEEGSNTLGSAEALAPVFSEHGWHDAVVVTDPPHTLRSMIMVADQGIEVHGSPTRSGPSVQTRRTQFEYIVRETGALLYYGLLGKSPEAGLSLE